MKTERLALALSGGGIRAMAFHAGVLRFLASRQKLEQIAELSTVSGGSLLTGLVFAKANMRWPSSSEYLDDIHPHIRTLLIERDLLMGTIVRLLYPPNWRFLSSRPNLVARTINREWRVRGTLGMLPTWPRWSINCTTAETGRRSRFKDGTLGDRETGYTSVGKFPLASAMAISAAFPVGFGPFRLDVARLAWRKRLAWEDKHQVDFTPKHDVLHLYDGGVYDNLGLEPLFDPASVTPKFDGAIVVSDAGAPLERSFALGALNPLRVKRLMDVMMDQNRALRIRGFIHRIKHAGGGAYLGIQRTPTLAGLVVKHAQAHPWLSGELAACVAGYPTSLRALDTASFDLIEQHGFETAYLAQLEFPYLSQPRQPVPASSVKPP